MFNTPVKNGLSIPDFLLQALRRMSQEVGACVMAGFIGPSNRVRCVYRPGPEEQLALSDVVAGVPEPNDVQYVPASGAMGQKHLYEAAVALRMGGWGVLMGHGQDKDKVAEELDLQATLISLSED